MSAVVLALLAMGYIALMTWLALAVLYAIGAARRGE